MNKKFKQYNAVIEPVSERKMSFTISTAAVDRDGDTIDPKGWDLGPYQKNPVVLWAHDYSMPPVGKATNIQMTKDGLKADVEFLPMGMNPFADMIHDMCKGGFLNATSVGFAGKDFEKSKDRERGYDFKAQELLEFSIVPVPSNPEALIQRGEKSAVVQRYAKAMRHWTKDILGEDAPKLDAEQFDNLADAIAKAMKDEPQEEKKEETKIDYQAVAVEVAKILKQHHSEGVIIDIEMPEEGVDLSGIDIPEEKGVTVEDASAYILSMLEQSMKESIGQLREMAGAQARDAINHLTGRLP